MINTFFFSFQKAKVLFEASVFLPYDPSQDIIYPPELAVSLTFNIAYSMRQASQKCHKMFTKIEHSEIW